MVEIRRIHDGEGDEVAALWDRMCRETEDGGPLTEPARRDIARMLSMAAWHRDTFCLVALGEAQVIGFVCGRIDPCDGLLPCLIGQIEELYVVPEHRGRGLRRELAEAALFRLREHGPQMIRHLMGTDSREEDRRFWADLGFEADMVCLTLYRRRES
ncbi:GNAT family N-acetyltransferase [Actinomadura sp. HBU206391]|uniref:GNAT family N-acetyltransferase n=1 Tax=Actinomadura sp. HBU206391 TaxID=2731692 RepID=UPI00164F25EA|nr:GNAT family N-acetyltransferase [Actinomadura sp. HBU206391]MBC6460653.1 GNAT family N-acetyltransferase [Actinomadura sp. HBU206391]